MMTIEKFYLEVNEGYGERIENYRFAWMTDDQWLCKLFLCRLFSGFHHIPTEPKPSGTGVEINFTSSIFSTFDDDGLTRLVIMAHNWGVRATIQGSGPGMIKLRLHVRKCREGRMYERHPTISEAFEKFEDY